MARRTEFTPTGAVNSWIHPRLLPRSPSGLRPGDAWRIAPATQPMYDSAMVHRAATLESADVRHSIDQRVVLRDVSWSDYEALLAMRGNSAGVRMAYLEGTLELMTPSRDHEMLKTKLARLLEAYAEELGLELEGYGSWTLTRKELERGLEPDECYAIGQAGDVPAPRGERRSGVSARRPAASGPTRIWRAHARRQPPGSLRCICL